jgi:hypothetical protein
MAGAKRWACGVLDDAHAPAFSAFETWHSDTTARFTRGDCTACRVLSTAPDALRRVFY